MEVIDFDPDQNMILSEKSRTNGIQQIIENLFRVVEISLFLISLTWAFARLPLAVKISGDFSRRLLHVVAGHLFIFLLGNSIVLTLFLKSRRQQGSQNSIEMMENIDAGAGEIPPEEIVYEEKRTIVEKQEAEEEVNELSDEEFQRAMEAFIDRQIKFHQQEKVAIQES